MRIVSCGIDFGTSNSSIAIADNGVIKIVPLEDSHVTIPSAVFFPLNSKPVYGSMAVKNFFEKKEGRFMRSLKRVLGTSLMKQGTLVNNKMLKFDWIIASFLQNLKEKTTSFSQHKIEHVVMGRPVHFVDNDKAADRRAQDELQSIAYKIGYKHVEFQFEPIAAAFAHEVKIKGEKLALVADLGGGTSDFTTIRLSEKYTAKADRTDDILANTGIRVGGNDFDKALSLSVIMPEIGYRSTYGTKQLEVPLKYFHDLAEWSKVNFLYTPKVLSQVKQFLHQSHDKKRLGRLLKVLEQETGHSILATAEDTKIALTSQPVYKAVLEFLETDFNILTDIKKFDDIIRSDVNRISAAAEECLKKAGLNNDEIELIILTGGSTEIPLIQATFKKLFPNAAIADENKLSSVGLGLAYDSQRKFG